MNKFKPLTAHLSIFVGTEDDDVLLIKDTISEEEVRLTYEEAKHVYAKLRFALGYGDYSPRS